MLMRLLRQAGAARQARRVQPARFVELGVQGQALCPEWDTDGT